MKLSHYALLFIVFMFVPITVLFIQNSTINRQYTQSVKCENELTSALLDAIYVSVEDSQDGNYLFNSMDKRVRAYDEFYKTLSLNMGRYVSKDTYIQDTIPALFIVDTDGFYVVFRSNADDRSNTMTTNISPIYTWGEEINGGRYSIRYFLDDNICVYDTDNNKTYQGKKAEVYKKINQPDIFSFLMDDEEFNKKRDTCIWSICENQANFYINTYNTNKSYMYSFAIPASKELHFGRMIDRPCMFAFMQGAYFGLTGTNANVFAFANGEVTDEEIYICSGGYYHDANCVEATSGIKRTMKECVTLGYEPHSCLR